MTQTKLVIANDYTKREDGKIEVECKVKIVDNLEYCKGIIEVDNGDFSLWLRTEGKLEWELNFSEAGEHIQQSGTMSYSEYWEQDMSYIYEDLEDFICQKGIISTFQPLNLQL